MPTQDHALPLRESPLGISVLIVGGGIAGLMAALEMWRQGLDVKIIERAPARLTAGELLLIFTMSAIFDIE
jgi:2-polyprenyl-6-methoxyphenol hydroxylase-like FAD-dependent oxidoreductase